MMQVKVLNKYCGPCFYHHGYLNAMGVSGFALAMLPCSTFDNSSQTPSTLKREKHSAPFTMCLPIAVITLASPKSLLPKINLHFTSQD